MREIWIAYLTKFVDRYKNKKLERARELYEQAIENVPAKDAKVFYTMYAKLEEEHGLTRHAMGYVRTRAHGCDCSGPALAGIVERVALTCCWGADVLLGCCCGADVLLRCCCGALACWGAVVALTCR